MVSPIVPYLISTTFQLVPTVLGHFGPYGPTKVSFLAVLHCFRPSRAQTWAFMVLEEGPSGES